MANMDPYFFDPVHEDGEDPLLGAGDVPAGGEENASQEEVHPLTRLVEKSNANGVFERKTAARSVFETFQQVYNAGEDISPVLLVIEKLADDPQQIVRIEIMECMPQIAIFCHEKGPKLDFIVAQHLLPIIVRIFADSFAQLRKMAHSMILILLEKGILASSQLEELVCPVILEHSDLRADADHRTEIVALMGNMSRLVGKKIAVSFFLARFCQLCDDRHFHVRKICGSSMSEMAYAVGYKLNERVLLPRFLALCNDDIWEVRKCCAETFPTFSFFCDLTTRKEILADVFLRLLEDQSRWVRTAANQTLGHFITTFSPQEKLLLYFSSYDPVPEQMEQEFFQRLAKEVEELEAEKEKERMKEEKLKKMGTVDQKGEIEFNSKSHFSPREKKMCERTLKEKSEIDPLCKKFLNEYFTNKNEDSSGVEGNDEKDESQDSSTVIEMEIDPRDNEAERTNDPTEELSLEDDDGIEVDIDPRRLMISSKALTMSFEEIRKEEYDKRAGREPTPDGFNSFNYWRVPLPQFSPFDLPTDPIRRDQTPPRDREVDEEAQERARETAMGAEQSLESGQKPVGSDSSSLGSIPLPEITSARAEVPLVTNPAESKEEEEEEEEEESLSPFKASTQSSFIQSPEIESFKKTETPVSPDVHRTYMNLFVASLGLDKQKGLDPYDDDSDEQYSSPLNYGDDYRLWERGTKGRLLEDLPKSVTTEQQEIVPHALLDHFVKMSDAQLDQGPYSEMAAFCVYNLPAVVVTLGPQNWSIVRDCYESLACNMQWKVRYTLASSLHELAKVIGPELSERDLVPYFNALIKDLDEVRMGILKNLANFIKILGSEERRKCLETLRSFQETDNKRNWRFRLELAQQMEELTEMYEVEEVSLQLCPLAIDLIVDRVAAIRAEALLLATKIIVRLNEQRMSGGDGDPGLVNNFLVQLIKTLCQSEQWVRRQAFASLATLLLENNALRPEQFAQEILPHLIELSEDSVPNVRIIVAKTLTEHLLKLDYFIDASNPHTEMVTNTIKKLQCDTDRDVRYFSLSSQSNDE